MPAGWAADQAAAAVVAGGIAGLLVLLTVGFMASNGLL
jgi:hypothetical protein